MQQLKFGRTGPNSLWPSDVIWRLKTGSTLAKVMALMYDDNKALQALPESMLLNHQYRPVAFIWVQFYKKESAINNYI